MKNGYIYKIINDINDKVYIGQTSRSLEIRFNEHCFDKRSTSKIHKAIVEYGYQHFKIEEIEEIELDKLDQREQYWIEYYDSYKSGYNSTPDGLGFSSKYRGYNQILILNKNLIFDSKEDMARVISTLTSWSSSYLKQKINESLTKNKDFLGYYLQEVKTDENELSSIDDIENWVKTLAIKYQGKHIYCPELDKDFNTTSEAAVYLLENELYIGKTKTPLQTLISAINKSVKNGSYLACTNPNLSFRDEVGGVKQEGSKHPFTNKKIICVELNKKFSSIVEAAQYCIDNKILTGITVKTAKLRISDVVRGYFKDYKGYHFYELDKNDNIIEPHLLKIQEKYFI